MYDQQPSGNQQYYPNSGTLGANDRRRNNDDPSHTGKVETTCPHCSKASEHWLAAWVRARASDGNRFFSLNTKAKDAPAASQGRAAPARNAAPSRQAPPQRAPATTADDFEDDIPF